MWSPRFRRVVQLVAVLLLVWTGLDLTFSELCLLDRGTFQATTGTETAGLTTPQPLPDAPVPHVDDCFCCSRCVEYGSPVVAAVFTVMTGVSIDTSAGQRVGFPPLLYRPPQVRLQS